MVCYHITDFLNDTCIFSNWFPLWSREFCSPYVKTFIWERVDRLYQTATGKIKNAESRSSSLEGRLVTHWLFHICSWVCLPLVFLPALVALPFHCRGDFPKESLAFPFLPYSVRVLVTLLYEVSGLSNLAPCVCLASLLCFNFNLMFWHSQPRILFSNQSCPAEIYYRPHR